MSDYQERVVKEKEELDAKIDKLKVFIDGNVFKTLTSRAKELLIEQLEVMSQYSYILEERIELFNSQE